MTVLLVDTVRKFAAFVLPLCLCFFPVSHASMKWTELEDKEAVCNDYSRAGYYIETITDSTEWIIFFESGGLCYSQTSCNTRFIRPDIRRQFATNKDDPDFAFNPKVNLTQTWEIIRNRNPKEIINPYMTSISTLNDDGKLTNVEGRDLMDSSPLLNPVFHNFNRVLVPYCSSDMWLAEDTYTPLGLNLSSCNPQKQFLEQMYSPESENLQFTFRGQTILKGVIKQLISHGLLSNATDILLAGSSAGGLGVVNNIEWIVDEINNHSTINVSISVLVDSAWFINFRGNIFQRLNGTVQSADEDQLSSNNKENRTDERLLTLIESVPQCNTYTTTGSPCCISLECILTNEEYFPYSDSIPVMVVVSLYDVFLLADAIAQLTPPGTVSDSEVLPSLGSQFILTVAEYGGAMNSSILNTQPFVSGLSYIATQCLQHVYFSMSDLASPGGILYESSVDEISASLGSFTGSIRHTISSGVWREYTFNSISHSPSDSGSVEGCDQAEASTMQDAINMWYQCRSNNSYQFRDDCYTVHCQSSCPTEINFLRSEVTQYPSWSVVVIVSVVISLTVVSILAKITFYLWKKLLFFKQDQYLEWIEADEECMDWIPQFPVCGLDDAVSIACLDLSYSVSAHKNKVKDERRDATTVSFAIAHHIVDDEEDTQFIRGNERLSMRSTHTTRSVRNIEAKVSTSHLGVIEEEENDSPLENGTRKTSVSSIKNYRKGSTFTRQNAQDRNDSGSYLPISTESSNVPIIEEKESDDKNLSWYLSCGSKMNHILKGVSIYFNPGELVGIMGPSGCGKTTFLDLLTGRRSVGHMQGEIFVNGIPLDRVRDEYLSFTGYVIQLATPYYEELTVRENLILAAHMKLPNKVTWREKFIRVEQVMDVTGLTNVGDMAVGGLSGPGISGGQKKRLTIALQLLTMPKVIFLDEPTSGLDSTASVELLSHLNNLADSNRTVVLTIHQPRLEIFHMFHKLILLCDGKIAYHGVPQKAYGFFAEAAVNSFWNKNLLVPEIGEHNPADIIMDMLGKPTLRRAILSHYQESTEPDIIKWAIRKARVKDFESMSVETLERITNVELRRPSSMTTTPYQIQQADFVKQAKASWFNRLAVLETRADMRTSVVWKVYLPIIFFGYGFLLGTTYFQQKQPLLIMAGFCVYSVASALFMFPVMQNYFIKALDVYRFENADGAGRASDIVIQSVARFSTMAIVPVVLCSTVLYLLLVNFRNWSIKVLLQLIVVGMALNQTWIALLTCLLCALPSLAFRLSPIISSVAGFSSGFFIPREVVGWWYRWIFYINPNYYGFSASAYILLSNLDDDCDNENDLIDCTIRSGDYALREFHFDQTKPYMNIAILLLMTFVYLMLAVLSNWVRHTNFFLKLRTKLSTKKTFMDTEDDTSFEGGEDDSSDIEEETELLSDETNVPLTIPEDHTQQSGTTDEEELSHVLRSPYDDDVFEIHSSNSDLSPEKAKPSAKTKETWIRFAEETLERQQSDGDKVELRDNVMDDKGRPKRLEFRKRQKRRRAQSIFLAENQEHMVFKPSSSRKTPVTPKSQFANLVFNIMAQKDSSVSTPSPSNVGNSLKERQQKFEWSIKTTQEVVKEKTEELKKVDEAQREKITLRDVTRKVTQKLKQEKAPRMANVVGEVMKLAASAPSSFDEDGETTNQEVDEQSRPRALSTTGGGFQKPRRRQRRSSSSSNVIFQKLLDRPKKSTKQSLQSSPPATAPSPMKKAFSSFDFPQKPKPSLLKRSTDLALQPPCSSSNNSKNDETSPCIEHKPTPMATNPVTAVPAVYHSLSEQLEDIQEISDDESSQTIEQQQTILSNDCTMFSNESEDHGDIQILRGDDSD